MALCAAPAKLQHLTANMAILFDFGAFLYEWGLPKAVAKALGEEGFLGLTGPHRRGHPQL